MRAMILAAGLGTRLRPLTNDRPKALVEVAGRTLLEITLRRLAACGIREVIVNVHHLADMVVEYLKKNDNFGMRIEISREEILLDTGGGLKKAKWFFREDSGPWDEPFIVHNVDVLSTIDFQRMVEFHKGNQGLATLAVRGTRSETRNCPGGERDTGAGIFRGACDFSAALGVDGRGRCVLDHYVLSASRRSGRKNPGISGRRILLARSRQAREYCASC